MKILKIDKKKLRKISPTKNPFLSLASSIIYQQISTKAGDSIYKKFLACFGRKKPSPDNFLKLTSLQLKSAGISPQKSSYLKDLAEKFLDKNAIAVVFVETATTANGSLLRLFITSFKFL